MAERYVIVPEHAVVNASDAYSDSYTAAVRATELVEKDQVPRVVVQLMAYVRKSPVPKVDVIQVAEVSRPASLGVSDG